MRHPKTHNRIPKNSSTPRVRFAKEALLKKRFVKLTPPGSWLIVALLILCRPLPVAAQTRETLQFIGSSQLDSPASTGIPADDLRVSPHPDADADLAGITKGSGSASVPVIALPQSVSRTHANLALAFNGLTHREQRFAGSGAYANTQFSTEPPDSGLAVGNGFVLQTVNAALAIYDASTGALRQGPTALNQFFRLKPEIERSSATYGDFTSDPRAYYDTQLQRWFVIVVAIATNPQTGDLSAPTRLLIAVSETSDPTQAWKIYAIDTTSHGAEGCPCFGDQPVIGADAHGLFISTNAFSLHEGFAGVQIYALSKQLLAGGAVPAVVHWSNPKLAGGFAFSVQPSVRSGHTPDDPANGLEYFTSVADIRNMLDHRIAVWAISNTASLANEAPTLKLRSTIIGAQPFGVPPDAPQKNGETRLGSLLSQKTEYIATNDQRMQQAVFADGELWSALTTMVAIGEDPSPHAGIAYFVLRPSISASGALHAEILSQGYLAVADADLFYPAIAVRPNGEGAIAFTLSGGEYYPSAAFATVDRNGVGNVQIVAVGAAPNDGFSGYKYFGGGGSGRTGDYSAATVDERGSIWVASEYIPSGPRTLLANWGTFIAQIAPIK